MRTKITFPTDNMPPSHNRAKRAPKNHVMLNSAALEYYVRGGL